MRSHRALSDPERARGIRRVLIVTLILNLMVAALKVAYGMWSGSLSIRGVVKENAGYLMDTSLVDAAQASIVARNIPGVNDARDVRSRGSPGGVWVELIVEVDGTMSVRDAHSLAHTVEDALRLRFPGVLGVSVHVEPKHALPDPGPRVNLATDVTSRRQQV